MGPTPTPSSALLVLPSVATELFDGAARRPGGLVHKPNRPAAVLRPNADEDREALRYAPPKTPNRVPVDVPEGITSIADFGG